MKYCSKCGNQLFDEAVMCPKCGCATETIPTKKATTEKGKASNKSMGVACIVCGIIVILAFIAIVALQKNY